MPTVNPPGQQQATPPSRPAVGNGAGRRPGFVTKTWHSALNLARWVILAGILVFLLTAILALHEALNFQDRVVELAGNDGDRARRVLSVLHDTLENRASYPEDRTLPYASIAVKLDRLSKVQKRLAGFAIEPAKATEPRADEVTAGADDTPSENDAVPVNAGGTGNQSTDGAGKGPGIGQPGPAPKLWEAASNRLKLSIADLDDTLKAGDPARQLVDAFVETRQYIDALDAFKGSIEEAKLDQIASNPGEALAAESDEALTGQKKFVELQLVKDKLNLGLDSIEQRIAASPADEFLVMQLDRLKRDANSLDGFFEAENLEVQHKAAPSAETQKKLEIKMVTDDIDHRISAIETILLNTDKGFVAAAKLAELINKGREFSDNLQDIDPGAITFRTSLDQKPIEGTAALAAFEETRGGLSKALQAIEDQLDRRTRVMAVASQLKPFEDEGEDGRNSRAAAILRDFDAVGRFQATLMPLSQLSEHRYLSGISGLGFDPQRISTLHRETLALIFVFVIGAIGSVIYITRYSIQLVLEGNWMTDKPKRSLAWYLFRPFFGVVVALAAFLLFKAGQLALGNNGVLDGSGEFNLPILSVIALFAGLLSWQALEAIETRGDSWFRSQKRQYLWATGLDNGLRAEPHSRDELASNIGRSRDQVFRWLVFRDRISPEMQDRIAGWLNVPPNHLFGNEEPQRKTLWLRVANPGREGIEASVFREELGDGRFHEEKLDAWIDEGKSVPTMAQDRIILATGRLMSEVFTDEAPSGAPASPPPTERVKEEETPPA